MDHDTPCAALGIQDTGAVDMRLTPRLSQHAVALVKQAVAVGILDRLGDNLNAELIATRGDQIACLGECLGRHALDIEHVGNGFVVRRTELGCLTRQAAIDQAFPGMNVAGKLGRYIDQSAQNTFRRRVDVDSAVGAARGKVSVIEPGRA